jgi:drug/metabolite transporter (DMT)-like permease
LNASNLTYLNSSASAASTSSDIVAEVKNDYLILGVVLALISALLVGATQVVIKQLALAKIHYAIISNYPSIIGFPMGFVVALVFMLTNNSHQNMQEELPRLPLDLLYSVLGGFFSSIALIFLNIALQYEDATKVAIVKTIDVLFSFLLQYIVLKIKFDILGLVGTILILTGTISVITFKIIHNRINKERSVFLKFLFYEF